MNFDTPETSFVFFGGPFASTVVLDELEQAGFLPELVVSTPDQRAGRGKTLQSTPVKTWASERAIPVQQPARLKDPEFFSELEKLEPRFLVVAAYGKIIPEQILELPQAGALNVHPSLLPDLRGPSPIESAILKREKTGVSIMKMDEKMDHGPILAQAQYTGAFPLPAVELTQILFSLGGKLLASSIPGWLSGNVDLAVQNHERATFTQKLEKKDAEIDFHDAPEYNYRKILAYERFNPFFFTDKGGENLRVIIKSARIDGGELVIERVLAEGRGQMSWQEFEAWMKKESQR